MSLTKRVSQKSEAVKSKGPKRNPEIDAKIDNYIKEHPERINYLKTETKDQLVRRAVLRDAIKYDANTTQKVKENEAINVFLKDNPEIAQTIEKKIANVADDQKQQARMNLGRREATKTALKM
jgi:3-methyladenine DNA glycosylase AlkC